MTNFENQTNKHERAEAELETAIATALENGVKCDEGKDAIILRVDADKLDENVAGHLFGDNMKAGDQAATKILKIYAPGKAGIEAEKQRKAAGIVNDDQESAKVPAVLLSRDLEITNEGLIDKLRDDGFKRHDHRISLLTMDYVNGPDLATYIFEKIIRAHSGLGDLRQRLEEGEKIGEEEMSRRVALVLGFEAPPASVHASGDIAKQVINNARNGAKLIQYLKDKDIVLDKSIFDKVRKALNLLHANGVYHNDLHERNIMMELDADGGVEEVYLIDFAKATSRKDEEIEGTDFDVVDKYKPLTLTKAEREAEANTKFFANLDVKRFESLVSRSPEKKKLWDKLRADAAAVLSSNSQDMVLRLTDTIRNGGMKIAGDSWSWTDLAAALLWDLCKQDKDLLRQCLEHYREKANVQFQKNFWLDIMRKLEVLP